MSDSPFYRAPLDPAEKPILENLVQIRDSLELLKADKSKYIRSQDVVSYYEKLIDQIHNLNDIRTSKRDEQNRLDVVLDDCLQLISLFFLTIGRNNEAPAAYSVTSSIKRLLDHLKEAGYYSPKDLGGISNELDRIEHSIDQGLGKHNEHMLLLLRTRVNNCKASLAELRQGLSTISPELMHTFEKLVSILRSLSGLNLFSKFPIESVKDYQRQLREIEAELGAHEAPSTETSLEDQYLVRLSHVNYTEKAAFQGKDLVVDFLGRVMIWSEIMLQRRGHIDERFREKIDELSKIRTHLEKLHLTQAWSLRETDLWSYQRRLDRIDEARVNGMFVDHEGKPADIYEQRAMLYLLRKSYATIYHMITSSEPVSEALLPIYNQLLTLRKCLFEVKNSGGVSSARELYPYSMKLNSIDNMRQDGKFIVNGDIPEGQGSVTSLLSECFEIAYELRADAEREEAEDEDEDDEEATRLRLEQARLEEEEGADVVPEMTEVDGDEEVEDEEDGGGLVRTESRRK